MSTSVMIWIGVAVLLFWSVGAYNRLVRLRSEVKASFAALDAEWTRQVALVEAMLPAEETRAASKFDGDLSFWGGLQGAADQVAVSLSVARTRPLEPDRIAALHAAQDVLAMAWERVERDDAHDLAGSRLPESVTATRAQLAAQSRAAGDHFNLAVVRYNDAIRQFPAVLLAWLFSFKPGRGF